jgi:hypothetical protein
MEKNSSTERFKSKILSRLYKEFDSNKVCEDSSRECVILLDGSRVTVNNKNVWSSRLYAQRALKRIVDDKGIFMSTHRVYKLVFGHYTVPDEFVNFGKRICEEWIKNHIKIVPLRDYMTLEHMRAKHGKERVSKVI